MEKFTIAGAGPLKERDVFGSGLTEKEASVGKLNPYHTQKKLRGFECGVCRVYGMEWKSGECGARITHSTSPRTRVRLGRRFPFPN